MRSTIQVRIYKDTAENIKKYKLYPKETYDGVINRLLKKHKKSMEKQQEM